jgi:pimeloyl-ACP methyl ester carboxylesterase
MQIEVEDVEALAKATGARFIFGNSSGALISLQSCLEIPKLFTKAVIFEPPLLAISVHKLFPRFQEEIEKGDRASALITAMHITEMGPSIFRFLPYWIGRPILSWALSWERSKGRTKSGEGVEGGDGPAPPLYDLLPTALCDFSLVKEMDGKLESFTAIRDTKVLLLSGTASREYLIQSCDELEKVIPGVEHVRLQGLDHLAACNKEFDGNPDMVATVLGKFLLEDKA